ncbi:hypothetical protein [Nonomuraea sp. NPDC002799]
MYRRIIAGLVLTGAALLLAAVPALAGDHRDPRYSACTVIGTLNKIPLVLDPSNCPGAANIDWAALFR